MNLSPDLQHAIEAFIRKYYKNLLIRGTLCSTAIVVSLLLLATLGEHFGWLPPLGRAIIFWTTVTISASVIIAAVLRPALKMLGIGHRLSPRQAAHIIGHHFPEVGDKLLNLLQLADDNATSSPTLSHDLLAAAIEQKTAALRPIPFLNAINLRNNRRYLRYALPPLAVLALLLLLWPHMVTEPTTRLIHYNKEYLRPAPFTFLIQDDSLRVRQGDDLPLHVSTTGDAQPAEVFVVINGTRHRMNGRPTEGFSYTFHKVHNDITFRLEGGGVTSPHYHVSVLPNPSIVSFSMVIACPAYTGRSDETLVNIGDATAPEGSTLRWLFQCSEADSIIFLSDDGTWNHHMPLDASGRTSLQHRLATTTSYAICVTNPYGTSDTLRYTLSAIADAAPLISVDEMMDSIHPDRRLFAGQVKDDYGFSNLRFVQQIRHTSGSTSSDTATIALASGTSQPFYFSFNMAEITLLPGDILEYFFEVSDNDAIHGPKTTRSQRFEIHIPSAEQLDSLLDRSSNEVHHNAEQQISDLQRLQQEINDLMRRLVDKKELGWQEKRELQQLQQKQQQVRQMMQQMQQQIRENNRLEQKYREQSEQLLEKQRELDRLMNEVMDEKMKETMKEIDRLMQEMDKKKVQQELEQLRMDNADLERQLDQNIELMKHLELEKKVEQTTQKLDKLAEEQRNVSRETEQAKKQENESLQQKQQSINEKFQQIKEDIRQIKEDYKALDPSTNFKTPTELEKQIDQHQKEAQQNLQKGKNKEASKQQQKAAEELEQMAEALAEAQVDAEQEDLAEDAELVRQLLKNLVHLSFNQEELISDLNNIYIQDPKYQSIITRQNRIRDDFGGVQDSLQAMARRQINVASAITKDVTEVNSSVARALNELLEMNQSFYGNYKNTTAARSMQYSMTSLNNLALVLAESLDKMQEQMRQNSQKKRSGQCKNSGKSGQQCNNPGNKPSPKSMREMQQALNRQMEALKKQLDKQGKKPGGRHQIGGEQSMSEELAKMAAQQEMIRRMMQEYGQELKHQDAGNSKLAREIDQMLRQMEQTETDLVNGTITRQTLQRQQEITTRMLQHERAEMEREKEERRESKEGNELYSQPSPQEIERYHKQQHSSEEQLHALPPTLAPFYRNKVNDYFYNP